MVANSARAQFAGAINFLVQCSGRVYEYVLEI